MFGYTGRKIVLISNGQIGTIGIPSRKAGGSFAYSPLGNIVSSCVFDIDATIEDCYAGSGVPLSNLEPTPADSSAQSAYDWDRGDGTTSTTYPTFTGTAGDSGAYFSLDGGDYFSLKNAITTFLDQLHFDGTGKGTIIMVFQIPDNTVLYSLFSTVNSGANSDEGIFTFLHYNVAEQASINQFGDGLSVGQGARISHTKPSNGTDVFAAIGWDDSTNTAKCWVNTTTASTDSDIAWVASSTTSNNSQGATIGCHGNGSTNILPSGTRWYASSLFNTLLNDSEITSIVAEYEGRHERSYV